MSGQMQHGYLVLADITGFTSFVAATELEHAHDILAELLEMIANQLTPPFTLVELEGDAVYVCAPDAAVVNGEALTELYEATYVAFRDRVEGIRLHTTCQCNACRLIPTLDLKYITHCGDYYLQPIQGRQKPVGTPVNLLHRLAKNHVTEATNWRAYALFSEECVVRLDLPVDGMHRQVESYEHLGEVNTYSLDLAARYRERVAARRVMVTPEEAHTRVEVDIRATPVEVWDWLNDPQRRSQWQGLEFRAEKSGRRGMGTRNHCLHGAQATSIQTVVDWRPFEYFTLESQDAGAARPDMLLTFRLTPTATGTHLTSTMRLLLPMPDLLLRVMARVMMKRFKIQEGYTRLVELASKQEGAQPPAGEQEESQRVVA